MTLLKNQKSNIENWCWAWEDSWEVQYLLCTRSWVPFPATSTCNLNSRVLSQQQSILSNTARRLWAVWMIVMSLRVLLKWKDLPISWGQSISWESDYFRKARKDLLKSRFTASCFFCHFKISLPVCMRCVLTLTQIDTQQWVGFFLCKSVALSIVTKAISFLRVFTVCPTQSTSQKIIQVRLFFKDFIKHHWLSSSSVDLRYVRAHGTVTLYQRRRKNRGRILFIVRSSDTWSKIKFSTHYKRTQK